MVIDGEEGWGSCFLKVQRVSGSRGGVFEGSVLPLKVFSTQPYEVYENSQWIEKEK